MGGDSWSDIGTGFRSDAVTTLKVPGDVMAKENEARDAAMSYVCLGLEMVPHRISGISSSDPIHCMLPSL